MEAKTVIACLVQAADAISAARPGARRENLENYVKRLEKLEEVASSFEGVDRCYAIQAGREVRIMVKPEVISDDRMVLLAREICNKIESDLEYPRSRSTSSARAAPSSTRNKPALSKGPNAFLSRQVWAAAPAAAFFWRKEVRT